MTKPRTLHVRPDRIPVLFSRADLETLASGNTAGLPFMKIRDRLVNILLLLPEYLQELEEASDARDYPGNKQKIPLTPKRCRRPQKAPSYPPRPENARCRSIVLSAGGERRTCYHPATILIRTRHGEFRWVCHGCARRFGEPVEIEKEKEAVEA